jgi:hypothetical protein
MISRKLILLFISSSIVNFIVGIKLLNILETSHMLVVVLLYMMRVSSAYQKYSMVWCFIRMSYMAVFSMYCRYISKNIIV